MNHSFEAPATVRWVRNENTGVWPGLGLELDVLTDDGALIGFSLIETGGAVLGLNPATDQGWSTAYSAQLAHGPVGPDSVFTSLKLINLGERLLQVTLRAIAQDGNVIAQVRLTRLVLRAMLERGAGIIVNLTSSAGMVDPPLKLAEGGWGYAHGATKAALHRMAGILHLEYGDRGIRAYNLEPGLVRRESLIASLGEVTKLEEMGVKSAPVEVPADRITLLDGASNAIFETP